DDPDDEIIVRTVVALASQMGLSTVAEGAETSAIADRLLELGCDVLQGFHLARPMPALAVGEWLTNRPRVVVLDPAPVGLSPSDRPGGRP
ncbi:MAG: EAL domain-containing protein, partial [Actinomycetota bacterium]